MKNIKINLKSTGMDLTDAIRDYVEKRVTNLGKLLSKVETEVLVEFEVAKTTHHHSNAKDLFKAECRVTFSGNDYYASVQDADLYAAIDRVKDMMFREIKRSKNRSRNLFVRGARKIKNSIKSLWQ